MDDANLTNASAPNSARCGSWTSRILLWTLASGVGLWLGASARTGAAGGHASKPSAVVQAAIADVFRFDILVAGKDAPAKPVRPKAPAYRQRVLPSAVLLAMDERPEPVPSVMPKTLSGTHPRFLLTPPARPSGPWGIKWDARMARLEHTQKNLRAVIAMVPGLTAADRESIQMEVNKTCAQMGTLRMERVNQGPEPPEPPVAPAEAGLERATQIIP
jgi:hypothetical protein